MAATGAVGGHALGFFIIFHAEKGRVDHFALMHQGRSAPNLKTDRIAVGVSAEI